MVVESKIKVSRFIGELTKFKMCSKADTLQCLKVSAACKYVFSIHLPFINHSFIETKDAFIHGTDPCLCSYLSRNGLSKDIGDQNILCSTTTVCQMME